MSPLIELSAAVRARRTDMGLTQTALARISGLSRATVNQLETGTIKDLSLTRASKLLGVLGLSVSISQPRPRSGALATAKTPALALAARSASVSYRTPLPAAVLRQALLKGRFPAQFQPHVRTLLEEATVSLLASVVEQLHEEAGLERPQLWQQMREMARAFKINRELWQ